TTRTGPPALLLRYGGPSGIGREHPMIDSSADFSVFAGKSILVTGGTGSFGRKFVELVLARSKPRRLVVYSRDEHKQLEMRQTVPGGDGPEMRYFLGDVRDVDRLRRAFRDIDIVVHA